MLRGTPLNRRTICLIAISPSPATCRLSSAAKRKAALLFAEPSSAGGYLHSSHGRTGVRLSRQHGRLFQFGAEFHFCESFVVLHPRGRHYSLRHGAHSDLALPVPFAWGPITRARDSAARLVCHALSTGMGIGIMFSALPTVMHFLSPPQGDPMTIAAARSALETTFFHWGLHAWAIYAR